MQSLTSEQLRRFSRTISLNEIGKEGQLKLINSSVLIVGTGALGSIISMYLAAAGIGHIGIADFDNIDISNLQRQLSFTESEVGMKKVDVTAKKIKAINSSVELDIFNKLVTPSDASDIFENYDVIIDGSDNPATKYMVNDTCMKLKKFFCLGGVSEFYGQVMSWKDGCKSYRDIFPEPIADPDFMPCSIGGVLGPLPGIIGSIQATETIKMICNCGKPLYNKMLLVDVLCMNFQTIDL